MDIDLKPAKALVTVENYSDHKVYSVVDFHPDCPGYFVDTSYRGEVARVYFGDSSTPEINSSAPVEALDAYRKHFAVDTNLTWRLERNTDKDGLQGIYSATSSELPCADYYLKAVADDGSIVAQVSCETLGDRYRHAQRDFGDQLEQAGYGRRGY